MSTCKERKTKMYNNGWIDGYEGHVPGLMGGSGYLYDLGFREGNDKREAEQLGELELQPSRDRETV